MKRIIVFLLVLGMLLAGCAPTGNIGENSTESTPSPSASATSPSSTQPSEETEVTAATEVTEPTESTEPSEETQPTETTEPSEETQPTEHIHSYTKAVTAPTCTKAGYTVFSCACGHSYSGEETAAKGHKWGQWETTTEPKIGISGEAQRFCAECGTRGVKEIDPLPATTSGQCGDSLYWSLSPKGVLTISGTGAMWDYTTDPRENPAPWGRYATLNDAKIVEIVMEPGITHIGEFAFFAGAYIEKEILIPDTVVSIGAHAFDWSSGITSITFPSSVRYIGDFAFRACFDLKDVYYMGEPPELGKNVFYSPTFHYLAEETE